jgi:hypothetical protein
MKTLPHLVHLMRSPSIRTHSGGFSSAWHSGQTVIKAARIFSRLILERGMPPF